MADKTKTIKGATDEEINALILRLRKESELQDLIGNLKRKSVTNDPYVNSISYDRPEVSTESPIEDLYHEDLVNDTLSHFGIPGMKWGKKGSKPPKRPISEDYTAAREARAKGYKHLTTTELKALNTRMQLEKSLRELKVSEYSKGLEVVKALTSAGTTIAALYAVSNTPLGQAVKKAITMGVAKRPIGV